MGAHTKIDELAVTEAEKIPYVCRQYLSHHIRNELASILAYTEMRLNRQPELCRVIEKSVHHIITDMAMLKM